MRIRAAVVLGGVALASLAACKRGTDSAAASMGVAGDPAAITKVVFIDQVDACDCTRARIAGTWAALTNALGQPPSLPVERIHVDTQPDQARVYTLFRPLMVAPGVYFVDSREGVVEMLQGEVTADAMRAVLHRPAGARP